MPANPTEFKAALGRFLSGVTVVAVETDGAVHGMTASAFLSVSLDPPLVLVSVSRRARMHGLLSAAHAAGTGYGISVLARAQEPLSNHFAGRPLPEGDPAGPVWARPEGMGPVLAGALARLCCSPHASVDTGDHTLFISQVERAEIEEEGGEGPLGYWRGRYVSAA